MTSVRRADSRFQWLDRVSRWGVACVFLWASIPKVANPADFAESIGAYGLLPDVLLFPAALVISVGELLTALGLFFARREALAAAAGFLLIFIAVLGYGIYIGLDIDCGCFANEDPEHDAFSGLRTALARDVILLIPVFYSFWYLTIIKKLRFGGK